MSEKVTVHVIQEKDRANLTMRYRDPITGKHVKKSAETANRAKALKKAAQWEAEINEGRYQRIHTVTWDEFRSKFEEEKLSGPNVSRGTRAAHAAAFNHLERVLSPNKLSSIKTETISLFISRLRKPQPTIVKDKRVTFAPMKESTIACHLRHLKAAFNWAVKMGLMVQAPTMEMPDAGEAKARGVTREELERMLRVVADVRPHDPGIWTRYIYGLYLSGLRLRESIALSWDDDADFAVDLSGKYPAFRIKARAQKGRRSETVPMVPDLAAWLLETPEEDRSGPVFQLPSLLDGEPLTPTRVGRIVSKVGRKAGVVVNRETKWVRDPILDKDGKRTGQTQLVEKEVPHFAGPHDLRRAFCSRWARKVMPAVLQQLARHRHISTTMKYYVHIRADEVAADLWAQHAPVGDSEKDGLGTILGTTEPVTVQNEKKGSEQSRSKPLS